MCVSGALDFLEKPTVAFVRLKKAQVLEMSLEASAPIRFIFVLIGSTILNMDYNETGRAMSALLSDKVRMIPNAFTIPQISSLIIYLFLQYQLYVEK